MDSDPPRDTRCFAARVAGRRRHRRATSPDRSRAALRRRSLAKRLLESIEEGAELLVHADVLQLASKGCDDLLNASDGDGVGRLRTCRRLEPLGNLLPRAL